MFQNLLAHHQEVYKLLLYKTVTKQYFDLNLKFASPFIQFQ
jgi:hypothetical protein